PAQLRAGVSRRQPALLLDAARTGAPHPRTGEPRRLRQPPRASRSASGVSGPSGSVHGGQLGGGGEDLPSARSHALSVPDPAGVLVRRGFAGGRGWSFGAPPLGRVLTRGGRRSLGSGRVLAAFEARRSGGRR